MTESTEGAGSALYPFERHDFETPDGRMCYVDEGSGPPVVLVHGTPTWSFLYRRLIGALSDRYRVIAPDHLGYGRSDKPKKADYRPEAHAARLSALVESLDLGEIVLGVHDFGGPIGLAYAMNHPEKVHGLILFNTWMWSLEGTPAEKMSRILGGRFGRFLYTRMNLSPKALLKMGYADKSKLTSEIHAHYLAPFRGASTRIAPWVLARELIGSTAWYEGLWARRDRIAGKPALLLWGMKDPAFGRTYLDRWKEALADAKVVEFAEAGHFPQEEEPERVVEEVEAFLEGL